MEIMLFAFGGVALLAFAIIGGALWVVFRRDADAPNTRTRFKRRPGRVRRPGPGRGGPTLR